MASSGQPSPLSCGDPQKGASLMAREVDRLECEVASLKAKLHKAQDKIVDLEKVWACLNVHALMRWRTEAHANIAGKRGPLHQD